MKLSEQRLWLTVDSDDIRHLPRHQGHPTRSRHSLPVDCDGTGPSPELKIGMEGFSRWFSEGGEATLFLIADQLDSVDFRNWLQPMLETGRLRIASHGNTHRSWAAWPKDVEGFTSELKVATKRLRDFSGTAWRPWFRAPAGYIAPWMAQVLAELGYIVDSSVNPTVLLKRKTGHGNNWRKVAIAMKSNGLVERQWLTKKVLGLSLPSCGPALHKSFLKNISKRQWLANSSLERATDSE
ncbi:MAG: polysaccharide deacetylase family protein, partial [Candidatus Poseidoniaceae archaeon]|nr:polysaccharide deacetylase family protein [Candidatus Poseidoniaceae archaeon]